MIIFTLYRSHFGSSRSLNFRGFILLRPSLCYLRFAMAEIGAPLTEGNLMKFPMAACSKTNLPLSAPLIKIIKGFSVDTPETLLAFKLDNLWRNNLPPFEEWEGEWNGEYGKWIRWNGEGHWRNWVKIP